MKDWTHPRLQHVDCSIHETDDIAEEARAAYKRRYASYPDLVKAGRIPADEARADLEGWRAIAHDWRWIAWGEGEPATGESIELRIAALDTAITRWLEMVSDGGAGFYPEDERQGALLCAMRWWAERERVGFDPFWHVRETARIGHDLRRANGQPTRGASIAAIRNPELKEAA